MAEDEGRDEGREAEDGEDAGDDEHPGRVAAARKNAEANERRHERADAEARERDESRRQKTRKRLRVLGIVAGVVAAIALLAVLISSRGGEAERAAGKDDSPVVGGTVVERRYAGIPQDGLALGRKDAPVRLVEFADLQCPLCREAAGNARPSIIDRYVKPGRVRLEFRNYAILGPDSEKAARALQAAADQGKAWQFIDLWYVNQGEQNTGYVSDEFIRKIARGVPGLDPEAVVRASNSGEQETLREAQRQAKRFGIDQAPSYLIGRRSGDLQQLQLQDPANPGLFAQAIDRQLTQPQE